MTQCCNWLYSALRTHTSFAFRIKMPYLENKYYDQYIGKASAFHSIGDNSLSIVAIRAETKWPIFCRLHFLIDFSKYKIAKLTSQPHLLATSVLMSAIGANIHVPKYRCPFAAWCVLQPRFTCIVNNVSQWTIAKGYHPPLYMSRRFPNELLWLDLQIGHQGPLYKHGLT